MKRIGLTGGIGSGKSTVLDRLVSAGIHAIDTDAIAREVVSPGSNGLKATVERFGDSILQEDGCLNRTALADLVFSRPDSRKDLEGILHPLIRERWLQAMNDWEAAGHPLGVVVIPLLFETGAEDRFDHVVCVACPDTLQRERLAARGWSPEQIKGRLDAQLSMTRKMEKSDYVIWNAGSRTILQEQVDRIFEACPPSA